MERPRAGDPMTRPTPRTISGGPGAVGVLGTLVALLATACTVGPVPPLALPGAPAPTPPGPSVSRAGTAPSGTVTATATTRPSPSATSTNVPPVSVPSSPRTSTNPVPPTAGAAAALTARLVVKGRAPMTGYDRDAFGPSWSDDVGRVLPVSGGRNGCDQRNDVLRRDLSTLVLEPGTNGCVAASGTLLDPYTGSRIAFVRGPRSADVQIDHVVALADAWQKGAQQWDPLRRRDFAGDPLNLLAVKGSVNQSKGSGDAATWLPPRQAFRCDYAARIVAVKAKYGISVTAAEKASLLRILASCPGQVLPTGAAVAVPVIER